MLIPSVKAVTPALRRMLVQDIPFNINNNLARMFFSCWEFDENFYLNTYSDLVSSIPSPHFSNAFQHFCLVGYREGRLPANPVMDEQWYMNQYSDVAHAIVRGDIDAAAHYKQFGYAEGRLPAPPEIDVKWYSQTYLSYGGQETFSYDECLEHFMKHGYQSGALPSFRQEMA